MANVPPPIADREVLTFKAGGERMALPVVEIAEIIRPRPLTRVPHGRPSLLGLLNLRGTILPIISASSLLGRPGGPPSAATRVIVLSRSQPFGLLVDEVADLSQASEEQVLDLDALVARDFATRRPAPRVKAIADAESSAVPPTVAAEELLVFAVARQEYALRLDEVQEIVPLPTQISVVPGSDQAMLGVMDWRGTLLPLVSLHVLLGLPAGLDSGTARVVVIRFGAHWAGLVADKMHEILLVPKAAIDPVPRVLTRGRSEAKIEAICRVDGGERLISLLPSGKIFDDATASRILAESREGLVPMTADALDGAEGEQFVIFQLGDESYGLPVAAVDEVTRRPPKLTRVPHAPPFIQGVMNLRGKIIPVIDQRQRFQLAAGDASRDCRIIIVTISGLQAGFIVDNVSEILSVSPSELNSPPELTSGAAALFDRIATVERDGKMILLIDPKALLDRVERDLLAALAHEPAPTQ